ncbi:hypothetical protein CLV35_2929 [Motilibacter peucedani]|uniref:TadE-like protein n=1 Tax=Motilibacter peucedani TaxID=598650 RepID=A0A420XN21_9ACTN|nr:pilus assembly protein [Motilibacter peucedani]RKS72680.1 hypothetical protein CLV35_2929 [Motilibacter peucedani]
MTPVDEPVTTDGGSALIETVFLAVLLLVPLTWVMLAAFSAQNASYAAAAAAREGSRAYVTTQGDADAAAEARARAAAHLVMTDFDASSSRERIAVSGSLAPGSFVTVTVRTRVPLPFLPGFLSHAAVPVRAQALAVVDEYR